MARAPFPLRWLTCAAALAAFPTAATAGPQGSTLVKDVWAGGAPLPLGSYPVGLGAGPTLALFRASPVGEGSEPFATDGTPAGTRSLGFPTPGVASSLPFGLEHRSASFGGLHLFAAAGAEGAGVEPWLSDGTAAGTALLVDLEPGPGGSQPYHQVAFQGAAYFLATVAGDVHFFRSDGTAAGTTALANVEQLAGEAIQQRTQVELFTAGDRLWIFTGSEGSVLIATDGSVAGTQVAGTFAGAKFHGATGAGVGVGNRVLYSVTNPQFGATTVYSTDGTPGGSVQLVQMPSLVASVPALAWMAEIPGGALLAFHSTALQTPFARLYRSDGTLPGTQVLSWYYMFQGGPARTASGVAFAATSDNAHGLEPHASDGTAAGTLQLADLEPGPTWSWPTAFGSANGRAFFTATAPGIGRELYSSDGTVAGTQLVMDFVPGGGGIELAPGQQPQPTPNGLVFAVQSSAGVEPWVTDGSAAGTLLLKNIAEEPGSSGIECLVRFGDRAAFIADDGVHGRELWLSDGTAAGTSMVVDLVPGAAGADPTALVVFRDRLIFDAVDPANPADREPWISDGTAAGTHRLKDVNATPNGGGTNASQPEQFLPAGDLLFFVAHDGVHGFELWCSDGTEAGTVLTRDLYADQAPGSATLKPKLFGAADGVAFMQWRRKAMSSPLDTGRELCVSDGTLAGTHLVLELNPGPGDAEVPFGAVAGGRLYFTTPTPALGYELWQSDGTAAGTGLVLDVLPGPAHGAPYLLTPYGERLLFLAASASGSFADLWITDGTAAGSQQLLVQPAMPLLIETIAAGDPVALIRVQDALTQQRRIYRTDGTAAGTFPIATFFLDQFAVPFDPPVPALASLGASGGAVYLASTAAEGTELWVAGGAAPAPFVLADSNPGAQSGVGSFAVRAGNRLFFVATEAATGRELHAVPFAATLAFDFAQFGAACSAALAAPAIGASGTPALGQAAALALAGAQPGATALLLWSAAKGAAPLPGGCTLLLGSPAFLLAAPADAAGNLALPFTVPNLPGLAGFVANFQFAVAEAGGPYLGSYAFSAGLELAIGP